MAVLMRAVLDVRSTNASSSNCSSSSSSMRKVNAVMVSRYPANLSCQPTPKKRLMGVGDCSFGFFGTVRTAYKNSDLNREAKTEILATPLTIEGKRRFTPPTDRLHAAVLFTQIFCQNIPLYHNVHTNNGSNLH